MPEAFGSYEELVKSENVDIIYVATPHGRHYDDVKLALEAGKAVLCEKAFTITYAEAQELYRIAEEKGLFLGEAMWTRFHPVVRQVIEWINDGRIGKVKLASSMIGFNAASWASDESRYYAPELGGGAIFDIGVYSLCYTSLAFGDIMPIEISAGAELYRTSVDNTVSATMKYPDGIASFSATFNANVKAFAIIYGDKGYIEIPGGISSPQYAVIDAEGKREEIRIPNKCNGYEYEVAAVAEALRNGKTECIEMSKSATLTIMKTMDEIRKCAGIHMPHDERRF